MTLPILDKKPTGRPHDYLYRKIQKVKAAAARPNSYSNPFFKEVARIPGSPPRYGGGFALHLLPAIRLCDDESPAISCIGRRGCSGSV